jgi:hypothetical protein
MDDKIQYYRDSNGKFHEVLASEEPAASSTTDPTDPSQDDYSKWPDISLEW